MDVFQQEVEPQNWNWGFLKSFGLEISDATLLQLLRSMHWEQQQLDFYIQCL